MKRVGPRMEPWGIPCDTGKEDRVVAISKIGYKKGRTLSKSYSDSLETSMLWSMVSKAFDKWEKEIRCKCSRLKSSLTLKCRSSETHGVNKDGEVAADVFNKVGKVATFSDITKDSGAAIRVLNKGVREAVAVSVLNEVGKEAVSKCVDENYDVEVVMYVDSVLRGLNGAGVLMYLDDVIIATRTMVEHAERYVCARLADTNLVMKDVDFVWGLEEQEVFDVLKQALLSEPVLQYPRFSEPCIVTSDASKTGIGGYYLRNSSWEEEHPKINCLGKADTGSHREDTVVEEQPQSTSVCGGAMWLSKVYFNRGRINEDDFHNVLNESTSNNSALAESLSLHSFDFVAASPISSNLGALIRFPALNEGKGEKKEHASDWNPRFETCFLKNFVSCYLYSLLKSVTMVSDKSPEERAAQDADFKRIFSKVDPSIAVVCVCGNHDVGDKPTVEIIDKYKSNYGDDYFSFYAGGVFFICINSQLYHSTSAPEENEAHDQWLNTQLDIARGLEVPSIMFQHVPWFHTDPERTVEDYFEIDYTIRKKMLDKLVDAGVKYVFCGHLHKNGGGKYKQLECVVTSAIGKQLGTDLSGMRVVKVYKDRVEHQYYPLSEIPAEITL
ncbi:Serine/threonine-protein phosphatase cpped1 [Homalodisca vitripennis]|nr:Serine/threonine-protein phosphatase cpped1 [Homalodisca vitripennis]